MAGLGGRELGRVGGRDGVRVSEFVWGTREA